MYSLPVLLLVASYHRSTLERCSPAGKKIKMKTMNDFKFAVVNLPPQQSENVLQHRLSELLMLWDRLPPALRWNFLRLGLRHFERKSTCETASVLAEIKLQFSENRIPKPKE